jgi:hypothetical protein
MPSLKLHFHLVIILSLQPPTTPKVPSRVLRLSILMVRIFLELAIKVNWDLHTQNGE